MSIEHWPPKVINEVRFVLDDQHYVWRAGDPLEDLRGAIATLQKLLEEPLATAIDPHPKHDN